MKKLLLSFFLLLCIQFSPAKAQWVTIPDANFVTKLQQLYPSCMNGNQMDTSCTQIVSVFTLYLDSLSISDLSGIQYFDNLHYLICNNNLLTNLLYLPSNLQSIDCSHNQIANLPLILPWNLLFLNCSYNQLTSIPAVLSTMEQFKINSNNIQCISNLPLVMNGYDTLYADISNNPLTCIPNSQVYDLGLPLCINNDPINNPNLCASIINISGNIYTDLDNNCNFNNSDEGTSNIPVKLYNSSNTLIEQVYSSNGVYGFSVNQTGTYKVKLESNNLPIDVVCAQADSQIVNLISLTNGLNNINFPVVCDTLYDLSLQSVNQGLVFPGQIHTLITNVFTNETWYNLQCDSSIYSGSVTIDIAGPITFLSSLTGALTPTINGTSFTYAITDFSSLTPSSFGLQLITDSTAQAGDQICVHVEINPTPLDGDTTNNVYDFCYQVVNSYDPNMKEVYPVNVLPGYDDWFTYTIHFQNTGNAPAFNIRLRDTLDANLDINTFEVRGYSHPAQISINGNILTVRFNNIMLPDSTSDYEGSMGYFQYRLKPLPNLPNGTQIENTAYIYFDYNAPIITNTTQNNFDMTVKTINVLPQASHLSLYPNPSNGIFTFNESKNIRTVEVFNMMGELVLSQGNAKIINLQGFPKGIYVARINGSQVCRLVKE